MKKIIAMFFVLLTEIAFGSGTSYTVYNSKGSLFLPPFLKGYIAKYEIHKYNKTVSDIVIISNRQVLLLTNGERVVISEEILKCNTNGDFISFNYNYIGHLEALFKFDPAWSNDSYYLGYSYTTHGDKLRFEALDTNALKQVSSHGNIIRRRNLPVMSVQVGLMGFPELFLYLKRMKDIHSIKQARTEFIGKPFRVLTLMMPRKFNENGKIKELTVAVREISEQEIKIKGKKKKVWRIRVAPSGIVQGLARITGHDPVATLYVQNKSLLRYEFGGFIFNSE